MAIVINTDMATVRSTDTDMATARNIDTDMAITVTMAIKTWTIDTDMYVQS